MDEKPIKFGILGCADIARKVSRAIILSPNSTLYAIGSRSLDKAKKFAADNGFPPSAKIYGSYEAVLDDPDVDAVYLPLPTSLHVKWAVLAVEKKKHLLLEKPVALNVAEFDRIFEACEANGMQFMDATMWVHNPRTTKMKEFISDPQRFGQLKTLHSCFTNAPSGDFLKNDIRVKPDLDGLGVLGDAGWYCIRSALWAADYEMPKTVMALPGAVLNEAGVILGCGGFLLWEDGKTSTFHCSFLANMATDITAIGTKGTLHVHDFIIPQDEKIAPFSTISQTAFKPLFIGWDPLPEQHVVPVDIPQESYMVTEFSRLVKSIKEGSKPEKKWPIVTRKTQVIVDAIVESIRKGFVQVQIEA
ncbi:hypothetical protein NE237_027246 [Protea cynaroides]|uniref:Gfo/Idh/MocA-like oxidoreductase N-terminal domain-containing protein n=1 Tax=Protea cynaroides TaxID=273540 RepID=A0A9Q0GN73_9MAGN|nr:hypothetical protein NE237_027246 [Protea cynaroides]